MNKGVALVVLLMVTMTMASTLRKRFNLNKYPELYERNDESKPIKHPMRDSVRMEYDEHDDGGCGTCCQCPECCGGTGR